MTKTLMLEAVPTVSSCERFQRAAAAWLANGDLVRTNHLLSPLEEFAGFNYGFVYLMHVDERSVKIGFSEHPTRRLRELRPSYGDRLRLRACFVGEPQAEREAHRRFVHLRVENERFLYAPGIENYFREERERVRERIRAMHLCTPECSQLVKGIDLRMLRAWLGR